MSDELTPEQLTADQLTKVYVKIRQRRQDLAKQDDDLKHQLEVISSHLLEICKQQGATTIRTDFGTVSRRTSKNYWTSDWDSFTNFVREHDAFALLQRRINTDNMTQFLEENPDIHPPGLNADTKYTITITKR